MGNENANEASESQAPAMVLKDLPVAPVFASLGSKAASGYPCRSIGFYRLGRVWAVQNKQFFLNFSCFRPCPPRGFPLGVHMAALDPYDLSVFVGFALNPPFWSNRGLAWDPQGVLGCTSPWRSSRTTCPFGHEN